MLTSTNIETLTNLKKDLKKDFFFSRNWIYQSQFQQPHLKRKLNVWLTMNTLLSYSILRS